MSATIDERILEMRFDNKQFESNIQTSMSSLDKLKRSLDLEGATKGLEQIESATKGFDMSGLTTAVETVRDRFSALEIFAVTALANIANSAVNAGKQLLHSLTVEPIKEGFDEYELKMDSVQTIMAGTGASLDTVMEKLNELNTYADKTIYSFADMTTNIGKFTNAGVDLDTAVAAIQGVANVAAVSGANANEASRAMYNFAQALSAGYVKLIDWKSIENANMATVEFKTQLLEAAVAAGTVEKTADGMYQVLSKNNQGSVMKETIDATRNFNDSLAYQWMTTEVLTSTLGKYADETTEIGRKAFAAAQDVKTFSQLIDTLKEAVGSGWAETWEIIFGNFEEAKALWTDVSNVVGGFIDVQSKARNELLSGWKELGGREILIESLKNAFDGLASIVKPIKEAFREIFPPVTVSTLLHLTTAFQSITEKFKIGKKTADNLRNTFKGLFAVFDIIGQAISALAGGIRPLLGLLPGMGDGILGVTGSIGEWIAGIDEYLKKNEIFKTAIENVVAFVQEIPAKINGVFQKLTGLSIGDAFDKIKEKVTGALDALKQVFGEFDGIDMSGVESFADRLKLRLEPLSALFDEVKKAFSGLWAFFKKLLPLFAGIATAIGNALGSLGETLMGALEGADFNTVLDLLNGGVLAAIGLGIKKFIDSLSGITEGAGGMLESITGILDGVKGSLEAWQSSLKADTLLKIASAIGILTVALFALSTIDSDKLTVALVAITTEFGELMGSMTILTRIVDDKSLKSMKSVASAMLLMSAAILVLSFAMKNLAELDWEGVFQGLTGVAGLAAILVVSAKQLSKNTGKMISAAAGLLVFAFAIRAMVGPVKELGGLDLDVLAKGLVGVGVLMAELAGLLKLADFDGIGITKGTALVLIAAALKIMAAAVEQIGGIDTGVLIKGLIGMAAVLGEIALFSNAMGSADHILSTAVGLTIVGTAMLIFSKAIESMGSLSMAQIGKGLLTMAGALAEIAIAMKFLPNNTAVIGVGLVLVGAALNIIATAVKSMGGMSWGEIAKGLLTLAGAFAVIGVAGLLLTPIVPGLLGLGAAVGLLGVGLAAVSASVLLFATALGALAVSGTAGVGALVLIITSIAGTIPLIIEKIGEGIVAFCGAIADGIPAIVEAAVAVITAVAEGLVETVPTVVETIVVLIDSVLSTLAEHMPNIVQSGIDILLAFLGGIADNIGEVVETAVDIVVNLLEGIANKIPDVIQAGWDIIISFIDGLADGIANNTPRMIEAIKGLGKAILDAFLEFFGIHSPSTVMEENGGNLVLGIIEGVKGKISDAVSSIKELGEQMLEKIRGFKNDFLESGSNIIQGLVDGVKNKLGDVLEIGKSVGKNLLGSVKGVLGIASPSKEMAELGIYADEGLILGLKKLAGRVSGTAETVGTSVLDSISEAFAGIGGLLSGDMLGDPVIRPVLDLSEVVAGAGTISHMLGTDQSFKMAYATGRMMSGRDISGGAQEIVVDNSDVVSGLEKLNEEIRYMAEKIARLQFVADTGALIGQLEGPMDEALGRRAVYGGRGI